MAVKRYIGIAVSLLLVANCLIRIVRTQAMNLLLMVMLKAIITGPSHL